MNRNINYSQKLYKQCTFFGSQNKMFYKIVRKKPNR